MFEARQPWRVQVIWKVSLVRPVQKHVTPRLNVKITKTVTNISANYDWMFLFHS